MSVVGEVVGIVACVAAVVSAYRDGGQVIEKIKLKRAQKRAAPPSRLLEESVDQAPEDIEREKRRGVTRFGEAFRRGDSVAIIALQQITIQLQGSLLEELRTAAFDDAHTDFRHLVDIADSGRDNTIDTLIQLRQRLLTAEPIVELSPAGTPSSMPAVRPRPSLPAPSPPERLEPKYSPPTWAPGYNNSAEPSGDEDTASGAESSSHGERRHRKRHSSILGFLRHQRTSSQGKPSSRASSTVDETPRHRPPPPQPSQSAQPSAQHPSQFPRPSISAGQSHSSQSHQGLTPSFTYNDWEDDLAAIWSDKPSPEHRESVATIRPPSPTNTASTGSTTHRPSLPASFTRNPTISVPAPTADNDYLGFCKGAVRLQNGDKKAVEKRQEYHTAYSRSGYAPPTTYFLACSSNKCSFTGRGKLDTIWDRVWKAEPKGLQFRWAFLAKSHVVQKTVKGQAYAYQCLFCTYAGEQAPVYQGAGTYLDHVSKHRGPMGDILLYKAGCVNDRVCDESEEFDINLYPLYSGDRQDSRVSQVLSDELMGLGLRRKPQSVAQDSMFSANEPWNEGLSDFHYGGGDRTELE